MAIDATDPTLYQDSQSEALEDFLSEYREADIDCATERFDINETIPELAYLTHNYFRYYGKFPSLLAKMLIERYSTKQSVIFDNFVVLPSKTGQPA